MIEEKQISSYFTPCWQEMHNERHWVISLFNSNFTVFLSAAGHGFIWSFTISGPI